MTFDPGDEFKIIAIQTLDDDEPEPDEKLEIRLSNSQGASLGNRSAEGTILDDSPRRLTITGNTATEGDPLTYTLTLDQLRNQPTTATVRALATGPGGSTASPEDYTLPDSAIVIIEAGQRSATLTVPTVPDLLDEPDEQTPAAHRPSGGHLQRWHPRRRRHLRQ